MPSAKYYHARKRRGLCGSCGGPREAGYAICRKCRIDRGEAVKAAYIYKKIGRFL